MHWLILIALIASPAAAADRQVFYGTWGTAKQCERAPIKPGGTRPSAPFQIGPEWLRHGQVWCRLNWFPVETRGKALFTGAQAQCGEDSVRGYRLRLNLLGDELTLRWSFLLSNGPLRRCPVS